ncbi:hypothetical protein ACJX0J_010067, partial [Zea mays]
MCTCFISRVQKKLTLLEPREVSFKVKKKQDAVMDDIKVLEDFHDIKIFATFMLKYLLLESTKEYHSIKVLENFTTFLYIFTEINILQLFDGEGIEHVGTQKL